MSATQTEKIFSWILSLELKYPVEEWTINEVHIWPVLRNGIYTELWLSEWSSTKGKSISSAKARQQKKTTSKPSWLHSLSYHAKGLLRFLKFYFTPLKKSNVLFSCNTHYRATFKNQEYNKFFDPLRNDFPQYKNAYITKFGKVRGNELKDSIQLSRFAYIQSVYLRMLRRKNLQVSMTEFDAFYQEISIYSERLKRFNLNFIHEAYYSIKKSAFVYRILLKKTRAKEAIGLCYYEDSNENLGMNLAAYELGIRSVDMQHGGQGAIHRAYARFQKLPASGQYEILPKRFWCWENNSADEINKWAAQPGCRHEVIVGGNPWLSYVKRHTDATSSNDKIVLYTLQPYEELMRPAVIECIPLLGSEYQWIIRLHPRMQSRAEELKALISSHQLENFIHPETFGQLTLPETLAMSCVHVCRTSGSIIEAVLMDVPSVIVDYDGVQMYDYWILHDKAVDATSKTPSEIAELIRSLSHKKLA